MEERRIRITAGDLVVSAALSATATADLLWSSLPVEGSGSTWGDEIYFRTSIEADDEDGREVVDIGDVGYWPPGRALCWFSARHPPAVETKSAPRAPST